MLSSQHLFVHLTPMVLPATDPAGSSSDARADKVPHAGPKTCHLASVVHFPDYNHMLLLRLMTEEHESITTVAHHFHMRTSDLQAAATPPPARRHVVKAKAAGCW